jgi:signal transduction histidine kinase
LSADTAAELRKASLRLALLTGILLVILLAISGATVLYAVSAGQQEATTHTLIDVTENVDQPNEAPTGVWVVIDRPNFVRASSAGIPTGFPDETAIRRVSAGAAPITSHTSLHGHDYVVRTAKTQGRTVQAIVDQRENSEELGRVARALALAGGTAIILSSVLAIWLARRTLRPMAHALALQRRFVMDASHELRTPLTLLSTRVQLLRRRIGGASVEDVLRDIDRVVEDSRELTEILDDLLIVADTRENGAREPVDLALLADELVARATPLAEERGISLARTGQRSGAMVTGAPVAFGRAIVALVDNAIDFAKSRVDVRIETEKDVVVIVVSDDGPGFPPGSTDTLLNRFASHREPETNGRRHYGIGLALVAEVAKRHRSSLILTNAESGRSGAVVRLRVPTTGARRPRRGDRQRR